MNHILFSVCKVDLDKVDGLKDDCITWIEIMIKLKRSKQYGIGTKRDKERDRINSRNWLVFEIVKNLECGFTLVFQIRLGRNKLFINDVESTD